TRVPGDLTTSEPTLAAMLKESLPPSMAIPRSLIRSHIAEQASKSFAPSPSNFAAHIQFPLHFTSFKEEIFAKTRLEIASITVILAPGFMSTRPLIGCSPIEVAIPGNFFEKCDIAVTATSARGVCRGPTHCC
ncbi:GSCOCG00009624001-RA-CDS, partial [Cotesia congregata]